MHTPPSLISPPNTKRVFVFRSAQLFPLSLDFAQAKSLRRFIYLAFFLSLSSKNKRITPAVRVFAEYKTPRPTKEETRNDRAARIDDVIYIKRPFIPTLFLSFPSLD